MNTESGGGMEPYSEMLFQASGGEAQRKKAKINEN